MEDQRISLSALDDLFSSRRPTIDIEKVLLIERPEASQIFDELKVKKQQPVFENSSALKPQRIYVQGLTRTAEDEFRIEAARVKRARRASEREENKRRSMKRKQQ